MAQRRLAANLLVLASEVGHVIEWSLPTGTAAAFSERSPAKQSANEDGALVLPLTDTQSVLAVADGLGGHAAGDLAASTALSTLRDQLLEWRQEESLGAAILSAIEAANDAVCALAVDAGTTLALVEIDGDETRAYHVGDSMVLTVGQRGKLKQQTIAHSPVGYALEAGLLSEKQAMGHESRHLVSNIIGSDEMTIELGATVKLAPRDTVLLASDGLADNLYLEEITERIRVGKIGDAAERLAEVCRHRMVNPGQRHPSKPDDLTYLLYRRSRADAR